MVPYNPLNTMQASALEQKLPVHSDSQTHGSREPFETEYVRCHLCNNQNERLLRIVNSIRIVECVVCGYVYANPRPTNQELARLYGSANQNVYLAEWNEPAAQQARPFAFVERSVRRLAEKPTLLDVGCGRGDLVNYLADRGMNAFGWDPAWVTEAGKAPDRLIAKSLEEIPRNSFDVLICRNVVEHVFSPRNLLELARGLLKPEGFLYLKVPGLLWVHGWRAKIFFRQDNAFCPPSHLNYFSSQSLKQILSDSGFKVEARFFEPPSTASNPKRELLNRMGHSFFSLATRLTHAALLEPPTLGVIARVMR